MRSCLKNLDILKVPCLYIYALMLFAVKNLNMYQTTSSVHGLNTRQQNKLYIPSVRLSSIQRGVYYATLKIFNQVLHNILKFCNIIHTFKKLLRDYLLKNGFPSIEQFLSAGHNDIDILTLIFNWLYYVVIYIVARNCCVIMIFLFEIYRVLTNFT